jgi:hypothetical protein
MFRWYRNAKVCYAYLSDVRGINEFPYSRWFTRGWTLQELVAPPHIQFYDSDWHYIGSKLKLRSQLSEISGIEEQVLRSGKFRHISIARKMSWAAKRRTTRIEDETYCLLGIFGVNMPLLYGEGKKAFARLQEEIMKISDDQSLFAWGLAEKPRTMQQFLHEWAPQDIRDLHGLFADSPSDFTFSDRIRVLENPHPVIPPIVSNNGMRVELQVLQLEKEPLQFAALFCTMEGNYESYLGFPLKRLGQQWTTRVKELLLIPARDLARGGNPYRQPSVCLIKQPLPFYAEPVPKSVLRFIRLADAFQDHYLLEEVVCSAHATYSPIDQIITLSADPDKLHAVMIFTPQRDHKYFFSLFDKTVSTRLENARDLSCQGSACGIKMSSNKFCKEASITVTQPSFAILVGGTLTAPWIDCVTILSDTEMDNDFYTFLDTNKEENLARACTTRSRLMLRLNEQELISGKRKARVVQAIAHYKSRHQKGYIRHGRKRSYTDWEWISSERNIFVDASLQLVSRNLVERSLFLFLGIVGSREQLGKLQNTNWWLY